MLKEYIVFPEMTSPDLADISGSHSAYQAKADKQTSMAEPEKQISPYTQCFTSSATVDCSTNLWDSVSTKKNS